VQDKKVDKGKKTASFKKKDAVSTARNGNSVTVPLRSKKSAAEFSSVRRGCVV